MSAHGHFYYAALFVVLAAALVPCGDAVAPDAQAFERASTAADGANRRETEYADSSKSHIMPAGKVNSQRDLREALNEWDANDPENDAASRASGAAEQSAAMELELERRARGNADLAITSVLDAVAAGEGDKRKVLYSFLSEDYREGGTSDYNKNDYYIRHQGERVAVTTFSGGIDRQDATFKLTQALCTPGQGACPNQNSGSSGCISIESVNWQKHFLVQHEKGELSFAQGDGSDGFKAAATFCLKPGLANTGTGVTMEPLGEPGQYLLHEGYHMVVGAVEGAAARGAPLSATFRLRSGLFMGFCQGPDKPTSCTCLGGFLGDSCAQPCPGLEVKTDGTVEVCSNQGDCTLSDKKEAVCICQEGFLGKECNLLCPRSTKNSKLCHGRGQCAVNEAFQPTCKCERGFLGKECSIACPGAGGDLGACSDHGQCKLDESGVAAECTCNDGFKGDDCFLACPRDQVDNVCAKNGECEMVGDMDTKCSCKPGWIGKACDLECPTNKAGDACSNHGECVVKDYKAHCNCEGGFLGMSCDAECPGIVEVDGKSAGCNGHGDCLYDAETDSATCQCIEGDGWLGEGCQKECKRGKDEQGNEDSVCSGHGKCALTDDDDAECQCDSLFTGAACNVNCPTNVPGSVCSGHGKCKLPDTEEGAGECTCDESWLGEGCGLTCPKDEDGNLCSGHGKCAVHGLEAKCDCDEQWSSDSCADHKCGTKAGFFDVQKDECKCPATSEKCCSRDVVEKAALLDKMVATRKDMMLKGQSMDVAKMLDESTEVLSLNEY